MMDDLRTAFFQALEKSDVNLLAALLDQGVGAHAAADDGRTALHLAAERGLTDVATLLLDRGADVDLRDANGATPLLLACEGSHMECARRLLERGGDPNAQGAGRFGALHDLAAVAPEAMHDNRLAVMDMLIDAGADIELPDDSGRTALCWAASYNNAAVARRLLQRGAQVDVLGGYALREALLYDYREIVEALLKAGADVSLAYGREEH